MLRLICDPRGRRRLFVPGGITIERVSDQPHTFHQVALNRLHTDTELPSTFFLRHFIHSTQPYHLATPGRQKTKCVCETFEFLPTIQSALRRNLVYQDV